MKKIIISISIVLLTGCTFSHVPKIEVEVDPLVIEVQEDAFVCGRDTVKDSDGNDYKTAYFDIDGGHDVEKEGQCWMAENLNVGTVILNPGEAPSDDGVIEKWCMTSDERAIFGKNYRCNWCGSLPALDWHCSKNGVSAPSDVNYCNGDNERSKCGGLYSFTEIQSAEFCPSGWKIPTVDDWQKLAISVFEEKKRSWDKGEYYKKYEKDFRNDRYAGNDTDIKELATQRKRNWFGKNTPDIRIDERENSLFVAEELMFGEFNSLLCGKLNIEKLFWGNKHQSVYYALDSIKSNLYYNEVSIPKGNDYDGRQGISLNTANGASYNIEESSGYSVRCVKK